MAGWCVFACSSSLKKFLAAPVGSLFNLDSRASHCNCFRRNGGVALRHFQGGASGVRVELKTAARMSESLLTK